MYKTINNKGSPLDNITLKEEINNINGFAIMIEQDDGTYKESINNSWPSDMKYNEELSGCIDSNGNKLNGVLTFDTVNKISIVETTDTSYCYLYFDKKVNLFELCKNYKTINECVKNEDLEQIYDIWKSTLENDGYRFVGTNPNNYICFGTTSKNDCTSDDDKYMYRIIGIFKDSYGEYHLKLIKKKALNTRYYWHSSMYLNVTWDESDLYKGLNGSYFLANTTYPYMQNSTWSNKIEIWDYIATSTSTSNDIRVDYDYILVEDVYLHEMNQSSKSSSIGEWKTISGKISLMYVSDYLLSLGSSALEYTSYANSSTLKTGWMHNSNNNDTKSLEWTMTRYGNYLDTYGVWGIYLDGIIEYIFFNYELLSVRPVFYLTSDVSITGEGTIENPYIITS